MPIKDLIENIGQQNLAEELSETEEGRKKLEHIGTRVKERFDDDLDSMQDWIEGVEEGLSLMKQEFKPKSTPWQGASNFKSPMLSEASIAFGDKASLEIVRAKNLVKADIIGKDGSSAKVAELSQMLSQAMEQQDQEQAGLIQQEMQAIEQQSKKAVAERITEVMNYQINYQMDAWREDQKRMLYVMPNPGCMFKKTVFDPLLGEPVSHIIQYPDFAVNQATTNIDKARSFTQILDVDQNGLVERQIAGIWLDEDIYPEESEGDEGSNEAAKVEKSKDNDDRFLEQHCFADLDDDGYEEPYIVTIHEQTRKVLRIVARYDELSFIVKTKQGRVLNLSQAIREESRRAKIAGEQEPEEADLSEYEMVRINPMSQLTKYGFIPSSDGTFLDLGYSHLLGAITQGVNATTNQLTDSGTLRNMGGGFLAKGFRKKMGPIRQKPGEFTETNIGPRDLQTGILPNPNPEPSSVLFALNEKLEQQGRSFAAIVDVSGQIQANTAPTTALAIIQEALITTSAMMGRILDSMSNEFQILFKINRTTFDPELYKNILDEDASAEADFNNESLDIQPTASPEMSSKMQRIQLATVEMESIPMVVQAGGNPMPIVKNYFERIGSDSVDEIFPEQPTDAQTQETARFREAQEAENQIAQANLQLTQLQTEILMREQDRLDADTQRKIEETSSNIRKTLSEIILNLEKAESEDVKNQVSIYTAEIKGQIDTLTAIGTENARAMDIRDKRQAGQAANSPG